jgi:hypothetical protein
MNGGNQALCDAILAQGETNARPDRLAAALVLLAAVDDDVAVDPAALPGRLWSALFDDNAT